MTEILQVISMPIFTALLGGAIGGLLAYILVRLLLRKTRQKIKDVEERLKQQDLQFTEFENKRLAIESGALQMKELVSYNLTLYQEVLDTVFEIAEKDKVFNRKLFKVLEEKGLKKKLEEFWARIDQETSITPKSKG
jgi:hypothetical protein